MIRKIIRIDEEKCSGCGLCAEACHEGAIDMVEGKAKLAREHFCDGFGDCLPECPTGAISFEEREAPEYDEAAVQQAKKAAESKTADGKRKLTAERFRALCEATREFEEKKPNSSLTYEEFLQMERAGDIGTHRKKDDKTRSENVHEHHGHEGGCPGSKLMQFDRSGEGCCEGEASVGRAVSRLTQFPIQIKLLPTRAPFYKGAKLLVAADCTAYAYANMHEDFMKGKITMVGCPKLDEGDYTEKLTEIISNNDIKSVTIVRMEVPCCGGLQRAVEDALKNSGKFIPWQVAVISRDGRLIEQS